jgi:hypothetical protein
MYVPSLCTFLKQLFVSFFWCQIVIWCPPPMGHLSCMLACIITGHLTETSMGCSWLGRHHGKTTECMFNSATIVSVAFISESVALKELVCRWLAAHFHQPQLLFDTEFHIYASSVFCMLMWQTELCLKSNI